MFSIQRRQQLLALIHRTTTQISFYISILISLAPTLEIKFRIFGLVETYSYITNKNKIFRPLTNLGNDHKQTHLLMFKCTS